MWIVKLALRRPYTFVVMAVLIAVLGGLAIVSMPKDIFPYIDIPVVSVIWSYNGISPDEMAGRITTVFERGLTSTVNDIEHIESSSYNGVSVIRIFFQPNVKIDLAIAQVVAVCQPIQRILPPGIFPPGVIKFDASSVPILQLSLSSKTLERAGALRSWRQLHPYPAGHHPGSDHPSSLRRKAAQHYGGPGSGGDVFARPLRDRHNQRGKQSESDPAVGHRQNGRPRILRSPQQQPDHSRRLERSSRENGEWRGGLHARCRTGPRRVSRAEQYRPSQRPSFSADDRHQERPGFHSRYRQIHQGDAPEGDGGYAGLPQCPTPVRSEPVRQRCHQAE